ncbi:hypothetical protein BDZ94DRAFT_720549 [Collybia nuda]|uniref:LysM domain-containing protein n=1 Tax=Collybia nuda TaxID=64659 RepID=A0A9P5Y5A9_9AGAR|nr:hypothetical protein BDZ94DRAFT_720549 [Collybia nuda]
MFSHTLTAVFVALPFLAQSAFAGDCTRSYTIKEGDICDSISAANNVSTYQLSAINVGVIDSTCSNLMPGNTICLGYAGEDCSTTYTVVADDSCEMIADNHRVNTTILHLNNPQIDQDCSNVYIGEVLCVGDKVQVPPAPGNNFVPGAVIPTTAAPAKPKPTAPGAGAPAVPAPAPTTSAKVLPTPAPAPPKGDHHDDGDDVDDEDLPFCDEL